MIIPDMEKWLPIPGFPGYEASSLGSIRSFRSANGKGGLSETPRLLTPSRLSGKPYYQVTLGMGNGQYHQARLHVLILETFHGPKPSPLHEGCHKDGNPENNTASNLRWGTHQDNTQDRLDHGTQIRGENSPNTVLTDADVVIIRNRLNDGESGIALAKAYGISTSTVSRIKKRQGWKHL